MSAPGPGMGWDVFSGGTCGYGMGACPVGLGLSEPGRDCSPWRLDGSGISGHSRFYVLKLAAQPVWPPAVNWGSSDCAAFNGFQWCHKAAQYWVVYNRLSFLMLFCRSTLCFLLALIVLLQVDLRPGCQAFASDSFGLPATNSGVSQGGPSCEQETLGGSASPDQFIHAFLIFDFQLDEVAFWSGLLESFWPLMGRWQSRDPLPGQSASQAARGVWWRHWGESWGKL